MAVFGAVDGLGDAPSGHGGTALGGAWALRSPSTLTVGGRRFFEGALTRWFSGFVIES